MKQKSCILLFSTMLMLGCFAKGPSDIVQDFNSRIEAGELESAIELLSSSTRSQLPVDKLKQGLQQTTLSIDSKGGIKKFEIVEEKIIGETAEVTIKIHFGDGTTQTDKSSLIKEDGKWKIQASLSGK